MTPEQPTRVEQFKVGDRVKCVNQDKRHTRAPDEAEVAGWSHGMLILKDQFGFWTPSRFVLASPKSEAEQVAAWVPARDVPAQTLPAGTLARWSDVEYELVEATRWSEGHFDGDAKLLQLPNRTASSGMWPDAILLPRTPEPAAEGMGRIVAVSNPPQPGSAFFEMARREIDRADTAFVLDRADAAFVRQCRQNIEGQWHDPGYDAPRGIPCCKTNERGYRCGCPSPARLTSFKVDPYTEYRVTSMQGRNDSYAQTITSDYPHNQTTRQEVEERRLAAAKRDLDSSSAKRRAALQRRYGGRPGIDLEQAWSTPVDES